MADNDLLIKINADAKNAEKAFTDLKSQTEDLESQLSTIAKVSAIGFAALTAEVALSVHAFAEAEQASRELNASLQAQGIAAEQVAVKTADGREELVNITEAYKQYADEVQKATGIDDDAIVAAQAVAQNYLGQTKITKELTQAIADLSVGQKIGLNEAATLIGKTIGSNTNAFARQGLQIADNASKSEKLATVLDFVNGRYSKQAEAANQGLGAIKGLGTAFGNLQEAIGKQFAPTITKIVIGFTDLFNVLSSSPIIASIAASLLVAGTVITALGVAIPLLVSGFTAVTAAVAAFGITSSIALGGLPILLGTLVAGVTFLALNWDKSLTFMREVATRVFISISELFSGLNQVLTGALTLDVNKITDGLNQIKNAYSKGAEETFKELPKAAEKSQTEQNEIQAAGAKKRQAQEQAEAERKRALREAENDLLQLQLENASQAAIDIKSKEVETLKKLSEQQTADTLELLQARYEQLKAQEDEQRAEDLDRTAEFEALKDETAQELATSRQDFNSQLRDKEIQDIQAQVLTENEIKKKAYTDQLKKDIEQRNAYLTDKAKYGVAVATIDKAIGSDQVQNAKSVSSELIGLAQSENATLKAIGKAAAITNITIATAESAAVIGKKIIDTLPFPINIPTAAVFSAARIAYGAEQIGKVVSAADGALVTGGVQGKDSVPFLLEPGELVVPKRNFEEVVSGVSSQRGGGNDDLVSLLQSIDGKLSQPSQTIIQGDVLAETSFIDVLIEKINDRIRFGNARLAT